MIRYGLAAAVGLTMLSGAAWAQSASTGYAGGLSPRDVAGKRLLDANGAPLGQIERATAQSAVVRMPNGKHTQVDMAKLALGDGPHTVIDIDNSDAERLNAQLESGQWVPDVLHPK
jgi:hypothetical protein